MHPLTQRLIRKALRLRSDEFVEVFYPHLDDWPLDTYDADSQRVSEFELSWCCEHVFTPLEFFDSPPNPETPLACDGFYDIEGRWSLTSEGESDNPNEMKS